MLAKIISYTDNIVTVTQLDIDEYGSIIPVGDVELLFSQNNRNVYELLKKSTYAAIFTEKDLNKEGSLDLSLDVKLNNIILVIPMTLDELNDEKKKVIESGERFKNKNVELNKP
ncbi:MAG: hypothetical protein QOK71_09155 [Nitrososphaeraceae archaeon]|jgi:hypothetical protein|nr:hypothetical protein [Nitrososphaeraceae archaeon]